MKNESAVDDYRRFIRARNSTATCERKLWVAEHFATWLDKRDVTFYTASRTDVETWLLERPRQASTRQSMLFTIKEWFGCLRIESNPAHGISLTNGKQPQRLPMVPSRVVIDAIIKKNAEHEDELSTRNTLMFELAYGSGLRRGELMRLDVEDVNTVGGTVRVLGKGGRSRIVPLTREAGVALQKYMCLRGGSRGALFLSVMGRRLSIMSIYLILKEKMGVRPHLLRHACATHMLAAGASVRVIGELLGHRSLASTQVYTHVEKSTLASVVEVAHPANHREHLPL